MDWTVWMMFALTDGAVIVSPGPAVLFVVSQGLRRGSANALWPPLGIEAANSFYFVLSGTGLGALLAASGRAFTLVRWAGAGYLLYLGATSLLRRAVPPGADSATDTPRAGARAVFVRGLLMQLGNPKALLFFAAVLPQFLDRGQPVLPQTLILAATSMVMEFVVLTVYGAAAAHMAAQPRLAVATSRLSGALLVGAALGLAALGP